LESGRWSQRRAAASASTSASTRRFSRLATAVSRSGDLRAPSSVSRDRKVDGRPRTRVGFPAVLDPRLPWPRGRAPFHASRIRLWEVPSPIVATEAAAAARRSSRRLSRRFYRPVVRPLLSGRSRLPDRWNSSRHEQVSAAAVHARLPPRRPASEAPGELGQPGYCCSWRVVTACMPCLAKPSAVGEVAWLLPFGAACGVWDVRVSDPGNRDG
jgi:hypothetical protein